MRTRTRDDERLKDLAYLVLDHNIDISECEQIAEFLDVLSDVMYDRNQEELSSKLQKFSYELKQLNEK